MEISTLATSTTDSSPQAALSELKPCVPSLHHLKGREHLGHVAEAHQGVALVEVEEGLDNFLVTILVVNGLF